MAPLPPESTARAYLDYSDGINQHTMVMRLGPSATLVNINARYDALFSAMSSELYLTTIIGLRVSSDNSNVTNPTPWTGPATYGTGTMPQSNSPRELRFLGRSADGRQGSVSLYGWSGGNPSIYRIFASANAQVEDAIAALDGSYVFDCFLSISTQRQFWKAYASFNYNSYWEKETR